MRRLWVVWVLFTLGFLPSTTSSAETAVAVISGTSDDSLITGKVTLTDTKEGLRVTASVAQAPPGAHGFHIHEFGSCEGGGKAAGGHFNPDGVKHGDLLADGFSGAHAGDLANIEVGPDGTGSVAQVYAGLSLHQIEYAVAGRAFIMHEKPDDFGQPTGNAGRRIGCGTIIITGH